MKRKVVKLPSSVRIAGLSIPIRVSPLPGDFGQCRSDGMEITISPEAATDPKLFRETLRHEMQHASLLISGVGYATYYEEECIVRCHDNIFFPAWENIQKKLP